MKRLLHCPFCSEEEEIQLLYKETTLSKGTQWSKYNCRIECLRCHARGPEAESINNEVAQETAINDWNNRIPHDEDLALRTAFALAS